MKLAIQFAMQGEAQPFLDRGNFTELAPDPVFGFRFFEAPGLVVASAGTHRRFGVDAIGTIPAALLAHTLISRFRPERLINAGTAGGFAALGGEIGDVYLGAEVSVFHDRRIPLPGFEAMGHGQFALECDRQLAQRLALKVGIVSTGDSLDCSAEDWQRIKASGAAVKEMEAAGIAWVCEHHAVPLTLLKSITDIVDHVGSTAEQFLKNYAFAVDRLATSLTGLVQQYQNV
jgi:5'-methylthioadenosine nucleosidase